MSREADELERLLAQAIHRAKEREYALAAGERWPKTPQEQEAA